MKDVFGEVIEKIDSKGDEKLEKINSILSNLRGELEKKEDEGQKQENIDEKNNNIESVGEEQEKKLEKKEEYNNENVSGADLQSELEEARETISGLLQELEEKDELERELAISKIKISDLEAQISVLQKTARDYMEKANAIEFDSTRMQVPTEFMSVIKYYKDSQGDTEYAKDSKKFLQSEMVRLLEKFTGKSLTNYLTDLRAFGAEPLDGGSMGSMGVPKPTQGSKPTPTVGDLLTNIF